MYAAGIPYFYQGTNRTTKMTILPRQKQNTTVLKVTDRRETVDYFVYA